MNDTEYIIVALVSSEVDKQFEDLKKKFKLFTEVEKTNPENIVLKNIPHITLKYPFFLKTSEEELTKSLKQIKFPKIKVVVDETDVFHTKTQGNVIVATPQTNSDLQKLHEEIINIVNPQATTDADFPFEGGKFHPHLTVLYYTPDEIVETALEQIKNILPFEYEITSFYLLRKPTDMKSEREIVRKFLLDKKI